MSSRSTYSSVKRSHAAEREARRKPTELKNLMRNYRKEAALKGRALMKALQKQQPKNFDALQKTGQLAVQKDGTPMPLHGNFLRTETVTDETTRKKTVSYKDIAERSYELSSWIIGQMSSEQLIRPPSDKDDLKMGSEEKATKPKKAKAKFAKRVHQYDLVTLVQFIPEPLDRESIIEAALTIAIEEDDLKLLRSVVSAGIEYKVNGPLDYVVDTMSPTQHLKFLQNKMQVPNPLDDDLLLPQIDMLQEKSGDLKATARKKLQTSIDQLRGNITKLNPKKKQKTVETAAPVAVKPVVKHLSPIEKQIIELQQLVQVTDLALDDSEVVLAFETLDNEVIPAVEAPTTRSKLYQQLAGAYPFANDKGGYYHQAIIAASHIKNRADKAQRFKELRDDAYYAPGIDKNPTDLARLTGRKTIPSPYAVNDAEMRKKLHTEFAQNATLGELMEDGIMQLAKRQEISDYNTANHLVSAREDDLHHRAYKAQADLVTITKEEIASRLPKMNITQKTVFEKYKAAYGYV